MMSKKMKCLYAFAFIFGVLAIVFYGISIRELDSEMQKLFGIEAVANIQSTVFAATCAILCGLNIIGAMILDSVEKKTGIVNQIQQNVAADTGHTDVVDSVEENVVTAQVPEEKVIVPEKNGKCNVCGVDIDINNPSERDYQGQHIYVCTDCASLVDVIKDEWTNGKKRDKAVAELKEKLQARPE